MCTVWEMALSPNESSNPVIEWSLPNLVIQIYSSTCGLKADFHLVQFTERAEFCYRFLLKCVQSAISNELRST